MSDTSTQAEIEKSVTAALLESKDVRRLISLDVLTLDTGALAVAVRVDLAPGITMNQVSVILHLAERRICEAAPDLERVFLRPEVYLDPDAATPSTSTIVTLSEN